MALFKYSVMGALLSLVMSEAVLANGLEFGQADEQFGALKLSGFLRAKYQDKSWSDNDHKISFDAARLNLDYQRKDLFGHVEYRCYQFAKLCDFSALVDGYVGYKINDTDNVKLGVQNIPFGPSRFWESNYYGGINTQFGLEDVHNLGLSAHFKPLKNTQVDVGFFPTDAGSYHGSSRDAARYSTNFVKPNDDSLTDLNEKNMWVARINQHLNSFDQYGVSSSIGASYWYSDIENKTNHATGSRNAWSVFSNIAYDNLAVVLVAGQNRVDNRDALNSTQSLVGSFDDNYWVANKGTFYTADVSYAFKNVGTLGTITPYAMYSSYIKDQSTDKNSSRNIVGVSLEHQQITVLAEYIMGKNDFLISGDENSYAAGSAAKTNKLLNLQLIYNF